MSSTNKILVLLCGLLLAAGCQHTATVEHEVKPVKIEPIHIVLDINIKVDRELDSFFDFEDEAEAEPGEPQS